ncbi:MAG TPA: hypothetical protein VEQ10_03370, partial [Vicinamibacteria bacterium]|nr:hypothetical protein [Vicinamibacteria bacterium]
MSRGRRLAAAACPLLLAAAWSALGPGAEARAQMTGQQRVHDLPPEPGTQAPGDPVVNPTVHFTDAAGRSSFSYTSNNDYKGGRKYFPQPMCGGVGLLDYDGDGK